MSTLYDVYLPASDLDASQSLNLTDELVASLRSADINNLDGDIAEGNNTECKESGQLRSGSGDNLYRSKH